MNNKGQAFSVFNLLIAAVVAIAILGLLMNIMGIIDVSPSSKPDQVSRDILKQAIQSTYSPVTQEVTFSSSNNLITKASLANSTEISSDQIGFCIAGKLSNKFEHSESLLKYNGSSKYKANIGAICGNNDDESLNTIIQEQTKIDDFDCDSLDSSFVCYIYIYPLH